MKHLPDLAALAAGSDEAAILPGRAGRVDDVLTDTPRESRMAMRWLAVSCGVAALGMWAGPAAGAAVGLVKLGASAGLVAAAATLWGAASGRKRARVEIDTRRGEIRVHEYDRRGRRVLVRRHDLSRMAEATLCNGHLVLRDADGRLAVSAPVRSRAEQAALRAALALT